MAWPDVVALPKVQVTRTRNQRLVVIDRVEKASLRCLEVSDSGVGILSRVKSTPGLVISRTT
jgi:hypothetical protein